MSTNSTLYPLRNTFLFKNEIKYGKYGKRTYQIR